MAPARRVVRRRARRHRCVGRTAVAELRHDPHDPHHALRLARREGTSNRHGRGRRHEGVNGPDRRPARRGPRLGVLPAQELGRRTGPTTAHTAGTPLHVCPQRRRRPDRSWATSARIPLGWRLVERAAAQIYRPATIPDRRVGDVQKRPVHVGCLLSRAHIVGVRRSAGPDRPPLRSPPGSRPSCLLGAPAGWRLPSFGARVRCRDPRS